MTDETAEFVIYIINARINHEGEKMKKIIAIFLLYFLYFQFVLAESENMIDFKVSKILDLENVITGKYDFSLIGEKIRYYEKDQN